MSLIGGFGLLVESDLFEIVFEIKLGVEERVESGVRLQILKVL